MIEFHKVPLRVGQLRKWIMPPTDIFMLVSVPEDDKHCIILETDGVRSYSKSAIAFQSKVVEGTKI